MSNSVSCDIPLRVTVVSERHIVESALRRTLNSICPVEHIGTLSDLLPEPQDAQVRRIIILDRTPWTPVGVKEAMQSTGADVIAWLSSLSPEVALAALELGVKGLLGDHCSEEDIVQCVKTIQHGGTWVPREINTVLLTRRVCKLTPREAELITRIACGLRNKEIAYSLGISEGTVKVYLARIFDKLGVSDRYELALFALRSMGILPAQIDHATDSVNGPRMRLQSIPRSMYPMKSGSPWISDHSVSPPSDEITLHN